MKIACFLLEFIAIIALCLFILKVHAAYAIRRYEQQSFLEIGACL